MWTPERVTLLKKLAAEGLSASQIANELEGVSRNAVIGKIHRLGFRLKPKPPKSNHPRPIKKFKLNPQFKLSPVVSRQLPLENIDVKREDGVNFANLKDNQCRWPFGEVDLYFCGRPKADYSRSYCPHHEYASRGHPK